MVVEALGLRYKTLRNHRSTEGAPPFLPLNNHLFSLCIIAKSCSWISSVCLYLIFWNTVRKFIFLFFFNQICDQFMNLEISFVAFHTQYFLYLLILTMFFNLSIALLTSVFVWNWYFVAVIGLCCMLCSVGSRFWYLISIKMESHLQLQLSMDLQAGILWLF